MSTNKRQVRADLVGERFGKLIVTRRGSNKRRPHGKGTFTRWWCECECGRRKLAATASLVAGTTKSCGCLKKGRPSQNFKWGCAKNRLWRIWRGMCSRGQVTDPRVLEIYQGVGTRDPSWSDFATFRDWAIAQGYTDDLTLDRINNERGYWPDNCRWLSIAAQQRNKTNNVVIEVAGELMIMIEAQERFGVNTATIRKRIAAGWPAELAVTKMHNRKAAELYEKFAS